MFGHYLAMKEQLRLKENAASKAGDARKMTREQRDGIIKMARECVSLEADIGALKAILISERLNQRASPNWEAELRALQNSPEYQRAVEVNERLIVQIEQAMTDNDLIQLLAQTAPSAAPN